MSTHKSSWKCIRVINDAGMTSSWHILDSAGRLMHPFQKQKPRNLHNLIGKFKSNTDVIQNEPKLKDSLIIDDLGSQLMKKEDTSFKLPILPLLPFPEEIPPLSSLLCSSHSSEPYLPPKLKIFSLQIPIGQLESQNLAQS